jgi:hypothetical protein
VPGSPVSFTFALTPTYDKYPGPVTFAVTGLPPGATFTVTPATIANNAGPVTVVVTINTPQVQATRSINRSTPWVLALVAPLLLFRRSRRKMIWMVVMLLSLSASAFVLSGCGTGNGYFGQQVKSYTVSVIGASGSTTHTSTVTLQVQ